MISDGCYMMRDPPPPKHPPPKHSVNRDEGTPPHTSFFGGANIITQVQSGDGLSTEYIPIVHQTNNYIAW